MRDNKFYPLFLFLVVHVRSFAYNVFLASFRHNMRSILCLCFKTSPCAKPLSGFDLHETEPVGVTHFHKNDIALVLIKRQKTTLKRPIPFKVLSDQTVLWPKSEPAKAKRGARQKYW